MLERAAIRGMFAKVSQGSAEQVKQLGNGVFGFGHEFDQLDKIGRERNARIIQPETVAGFAQFRFAETVKLTSAAAAELDLAFEEEIEPPSKAALRLARTLGDRLHFPMQLGQPRDDEARLSELGFPKEYGGGGVQAG